MEAFFTGVALMAVAAVLLGIALARAAGKTPPAPPVTPCGPNRGGGWSCRPWGCTEAQRCPLEALR